MSQRSISKCLGYLWLGNILVMWRPRKVHHFGVIDYDIPVTVVIRWLDCANFSWCWSIIINIFNNHPLGPYSRLWHINDTIDIHYIPGSAPTCVSGGLTLHDEQLMKMLGVFFLNFCLLHNVLTFRVSSTLMLHNTI